jgi:uncharacterized protein YwqG
MNWFKNLFSSSKTNAEPKTPSPPTTFHPEMTIESLREKYGNLAKPAIHLLPADTSEFSQLGGEPLLPEDFVWPQWNGKPQSFLAQIDLAEVHRVLPSFLPSTGLLYFFYDQEQSIWGFDPKDHGGWTVFYFNGDRRLLKPRPTPAGMEEHATFNKKHIHPSLIQTFPQSPDGLDSEQEGDAYHKLCRAPFGEHIAHQILGHPSPVQGDDMELECQLASKGINVGRPEGYKDPRRAKLEAGAKDWKLLLQLDTDDDTGWMWGDTGTIYFWIREQDAARADFSKVWMVFQCC